MGGRPLLSGSFENYQKNAKMIENYVIAHAPPHADDGLKIGLYHILEVQNPN